MKAMEGSALWKKHERTLARNHANSAVPAILDGFVTDGALTTGPVHPNTADARFGAITHDLVCYLG